MCSSDLPVEQHDAFDVLQDRALIVLDLALAIDGDDIAIGLKVGDFRRTEIKHRPTRRVVHRPPERLGQARPRQSDFQHRILEMQGGQPRGAERPILLLRMLQDQQRNAVLDRHNAVADTQRRRLVAVRTVGRHLRRNGVDLGLGLSGHGPLYALWP